MNSFGKRPTTAFVQSRLLFLLLTLFVIPVLLLHAAPPAWWSQRGATNANPAEDHAAANLGQLKHFTSKAAAELNANLPGGAGITINNLITTWQQPPASGLVRDDTSALTVGQLKSIAKPFYDRLIAIGYTTTHPWTTNTTADDDNTALANLGQIKKVFAFDLTNFVDSNGIPNTWKQSIVDTNPNDNITYANQVLPGDDFDGDGFTNLEEFSAGTNPILASSFPSTDYTVPQTGLKLWLRAGDITNSPVNSWPNKANLATTATQTQYSQQPTLVTNALNGKPVVHFDGQNDYLNLPNVMSSASAGDVFVILRSINGASYDPSDYSITHGVYFETDKGLMRFGSETMYSDTGSDYYPAFDYTVNDTFGSTTNQYVGNPLQDLQGYHIYNATSSPSRWTACFNGIQQTINTNNTVGFTAEPTLGSHGFSRFTGDIAELLVYDRVLSETERQEITFYLGAKYGLTGPAVAPTSLTAKSLRSNQVLLTWSYPRPQFLTRFEIQRAGADGVFSSIDFVTNTTSFLDTTIQPDQSYQYRIREKNSDFSSIVYCQTFINTTALPRTAMSYWFRADADASSPISIWINQANRAEATLQTYPNGQPLGQDSNPAVVENAFSGRPVLRFTHPYFTYQRFLLPASATNQTTGEIYAVLKNGSISYLGAPGFGRWNATFNNPQSFATAANTIGFFTGNYLDNYNAQFLGDLVEVIFFNKFLTLSEKNAVEVYFHQRYNLLLPEVVDSDGDGLSDNFEAQIGTDPLSPDTNHDGIGDLREYQLGIDPANNDLDGDGSTNAQEIALGTNSFYADTDRDGVNDAQDAYPLDATRTAFPPDATPGAGPQVTLIGPAGAALLP